jgi:hypothetical protein
MTTTIQASMSQNATQARRRSVRQGPLAAVDRVRPVTSPPHGALAMQPSRRDDQVQAEEAVVGGQGELARAPLTTSGSQLVAARV